jgi:hypothetical protein
MMRTATRDTGATRTSLSVAAAVQQVRVTDGEFANDRCLYVDAALLPSVRSGDRLLVLGGDSVVDGEVLKVVGGVVRIQVLFDTVRSTVDPSR